MSYFLIIILYNNIISCNTYDSVNIVLDIKNIFYTFS